MLRAVFIATCTVGTLAAEAFPQDCRYEAERSGTVDAANARALVLEAGAGSLRVEGRAGLGEVRIRGRACASDEELLDQLDFDARRRGDVVEVVTQRVDNRSSWRERRYARLDLTVEVPAGLATEIEDGSGSIVLRNLGESRIEDGSGSIDVIGIAGRLDITDGSGGINVQDVTGDVTIDDGSGEIEVRNIDGELTIDDSSGEIDVAGIGRSVRIDDSSGSIRVDDVAGDFVVTSDGSGSIRHRAVRGAVDIPRKRR